MGCQAWEGPTRPSHQPAVPRTAGGAGQGPSLLRWDCVTGQDPSAERGDVVPRLLQETCRRLPGQVTRGSRARGVGLTPHHGDVSAKHLQR